MITKTNFNFKKITILVLSMGLFFCGDVVFGQVYTPSGTIQGNSGNDNVGIGEANPQDKLVVRGNMRVGIQKGNGEITSSLFQNAGGVIIGDAGFIVDNNNTGLNTVSKTHLRFYVGEQWTDTPSQAMIITQGSRVGIGTNSPDGALSVVGGITAAYEESETNYVKMGHGGSNGYINMAGNGNLDFRRSDATKMTLTGNGQLVIGDVNSTLLGNAANSNYKLFVTGGMITEEARVELSTDWPDYVFEEEYKLSSLEEVENHIESEGHLHNTPSAAEIAAEDNTIELGAITVNQQEKIEELFLHIIEMNKELKALRQKVKSLEGK